MDGDPRLRPPPGGGPGGAERRPGGAPARFAELVAFGAGTAALERLRGRDAALRRIDRRDAAAAGAGETLAVVVAGATALAVLLLAASAARAGAIDRVEIAALVLLAIAAFEATQPLAPALRTIPATLGAGRRVAALVERRPVVRDPARPQRPRRFPRWP